MNPILADIATLASVILLDLVLAADNAVAVGMAAASLPTKQRNRAVLIGILAALGLRIVFALLAVQLLQIKGLLLVGGLLLFWVGWRMWQDLQKLDSEEHAHPESQQNSGTTFLRALTSIVIADVSMSLDNVLSVAAIARHSPVIMAFGLVLSVVLMGVAASVIAGIVHKHRWIAVFGIAVIVFAAVRMIWEDAHHFLPTIIPGMPSWLGAPHPPA